MDYYEDFDPSQYDENWEFNSVINDLIEKEVDLRTEKVQESLAKYMTRNNELTKENSEFKSKIITLESRLSQIENKNSFFDDIVNSINKDTVESFIKIIYNPDFNEGNSFDYAPVWFRLIVNYYSNKGKIISFLRYCGIDVPKSADNFRLPLNWNKEEIDAFFDNINNHYVCNGCIYSDNIGFWYREGLWDKPIDNCKHNYSEIPWQFVLRNPILNSLEYCEKMAAAINKGSHGLYFIKVCDYQKLSDENLSIFLNSIKITDRLDRDVVNLLIKNVKVLNEKNLDKLYPYIKNSYRAIDTFVLMPKKYVIKYLHEDNVKAKDLIPEIKIFTKEEKLKLLAEFIS
jgi:hypothetical protein